MKLIAGAALAAALATPALAQQPAQPQPSAASILAPAPVTSAVLRAGTPVPLKMAEGLTTKGKKLRVGQRFQLQVAEDVKVNGVTVVPAGSPATGEVTDVRNKGMWGKSGKLEFRPLYVKLGDRQIRISANATRDKGKAGTAAVVGAVVFMPIAGFLVTGTSARIPAQTPVVAQLDEDVPVVFAGPVETRALVVPAVAPAMPSAAATKVEAATATQNPR